MKRRSSSSPGVKEYVNRLYAGGWRGRVLVTVSFAVTRPWLLSDWWLVVVTVAGVQICSSPHFDRLENNRRLKTLRVELVDWINNPLVPNPQRESLALGVVLMVQLSFFIPGGSMQNSYIPVFQSFPQYAGNWRYNNSSIGRRRKGIIMDQSGED